MTRAVVWGGDCFVAQILRDKLKEQGIKVIDGDIDDSNGEANYYFDFEGKTEEWGKIPTKARLAVVGIKGISEGERWKKELGGSNLNWRVVEGENVYGVGMDIENFLGKAFDLAARNKNLILPSSKKIYRVLAGEDLVEAILRSCFFSGTLGKLFVVEGVEISSKIIAEVLIEEAKMTRLQVVESEDGVEPVFAEGDGEAKENSKKILRWKAKIDFKEGARAVVQYFVARTDEENRKKPAKKTERKYAEVKREVTNNLYEVVTEEEEVEQEIEIEAEEKPADTKSFGEVKEKFNWESLLNKSPLPDRAIISESIDLDTSPVKIEKEKINPPPTAAGTYLEEGRLENNIETKKKTNFKLNFKNKNYFKWIIWVILGMLLIIFSVNAIKMAMIPKQLKAVENLIETGKYDEATQKITALKGDNQYWLGIVGGGKIGALLKVEEGAINALSLGLEIAKDGEQAAGSFFGKNEMSMSEELPKISNNLEALISELGILQGRLSTGWQWLPGRFRDKISSFEETVKEKRQVAEDVDKLIPILPEFLGLDGTKRVYMVLLQNENELRASGGFIGSYGILTINDGKWQDLEINDVYQADGQLKGHVEPPAEIKKYLGEAGWFMRDANWQASFPLASKDIQWFLEKETGRQVDGVVALNLETVKGILGVLGEVYVPDFKEKINQSNLYEEAEYYAENDSFAGSGQKASFLGAVSKQLVEEVKGMNGANGEKLIEILVDLLNRREILVNLNQSAAQQSVASAGWDGAIYQGKCTGENCLADYLYIVESNFGVNKANYFLYRNIERSVDINENGISNDLSISYENTAKSSAWPGGDYKNYLRIYVPAASVVTEVSWSEVDSGEKKIVSGDDLEISNVDGKEEIGFLVTVPVGKKIKVEVKYTESMALKNLQKFSYLSYVQKQSGFGDTGMVTLISVPQDWQILGVNPAANVVGGKLLFNQKLDGDIKMGVEISR